MATYHEIEFETELCEQLESSGWLCSTTDTGYDKERALFPEDLLGDTDIGALSQHEEAARVGDAG